MDKPDTDDMKEFISEFESISEHMGNNPSLFLKLTDALLSRFYQQGKLSILLIPCIKTRESEVITRLTTQDGTVIDDIRPYFAKPARVLNG